MTDHFGTIGGGYGNRAGDAAGTVSDRVAATVGGGASNDASGGASTVSGGYRNTASASLSLVGGGFGNNAVGVASTVTGGADNDANGDYSMIPGGNGNIANGEASFAAGRNARAMHDGAFVWADNSPFDFRSVDTNTFRIRATGGMRVVTEVDPNDGGITWSCLATAGNAWSCASDRNLKHSLVELDDGRCCPGSRRCRSTSGSRRERTST